MPDLPFATLNPRKLSAGFFPAGGEGSAFGRLVRDGVTMMSFRFVTVTFRLGRRRCLLRLLGACVRRGLGPDLET